MEKKDKELLFKDLCMRLPYGVKGVEWSPENDLHSLVSVENVGATRMLWANDVRCISDRIDCKPILHPLSDLTKEIEHNGERFVPLIRLVNEFMYDLKRDWRTKKDCIFHCEEISETEIKKVYFEFTDGAFLYNNELAELKSGKSHLDLIYWLYEHHFNVNDLPEHLWIDVNTLDQNPYKD